MPTLKIINNPQNEQGMHLSQEFYITSQETFMDNSQVNVQHRVQQTEQKPKVSVSPSI